MAFSRDEILKAWNEAVGNLDNPTDTEIAAATAVVCAKCGVRPDDIRGAPRASLAEVKRPVAAADRTLHILKTMVAKESEGTLPGLPGGPPLKH
jgi:hypothetical protein